jgi:transposase
MDTSVSGRRRNRSWPEALKQEIVAASFEPGASVSLVARRYDLNTNQLFSWRKLHRQGRLSPGSAALVPVRVEAEVGRAVADAGDRIEIEVPGGYRIRVGPGVDGRALRRVLDVLVGR